MYSGRNFRPSGTSAPSRAELPAPRNFRPVWAGISGVNLTEIPTFFSLLFLFGRPDMSAHLCFPVYLFIFLQVIPLVVVTSVRPLALRALALLRFSLRDRKSVV